MKRLLTTAIAMVLLSAPLAAQQAMVKRNVNLRPTPSNDQDSKRLLEPPEALTLADPNPTAGYYHVTTTKAEDGWVWGRNIIFVGAPLKGPFSASDPDRPPLPAGGTHVTRKPKCPPVGRYKKKVGGVEKLFVNSPASNGGLLSMAKRFIPSGSARTMTFDDFRSLQSATAKALSYDPKAGDIEIPGNRNKLQSLTIASGTFSEGDHVRLAGYITEANKQGGEKVNCYDPAQDDIHINIAPKNKGREDGIVVETIPQLDNPVEWKESTFKKLGTKKLQVLVIGGLTYDSEHRINDDLKHPIKSGEPWRFSLWEIHPVTRFYVCETGTCDPDSVGDWIALSAWARKNK